jgi:hypothetical protein
MEIMTRMNSRFLKSSLSIVLLSSGLIGCCLGFYHATWQDSVKIGQILAGITRYHSDNLNYMNHVKLFSIVNQISAILLYLFHSEKIVSIFISGLLGAISFQAISAFIFAFNKNAAISILGTVLIYLSTTYQDNGVVYPIWLLGHSATFGILGLSFIMLVIALIGANAYKFGLVFLGLAPSVHPSLGIWLYIIILITSFFHLDFVRTLLKKYYLYFVFGLAISMMSLIYQIYLMQNLWMTPSGTDALYYEYIKNWDYHRVKFYFDYTTQQINILKPGIIICLCSIVVSLMCIRYFKDKESNAFVAILIAVSGVCSLLLAGTTHILPENLPILLWVIMPGRYVNLNIILFEALLLGILTSDNNNRSKINHYVFILFLAGICLPFRFKIIVIAVVMVWLAYLGLKDCAFISNNLSRFHRIVSQKCDASLFFPNKAISFIFNQKNMHGYTCFILLTIAVYMMIIPACYSNPFVEGNDFRDWKNDAFYLKVSRQKGLLLITSDFDFIPLRTRRPLLFDPTVLDCFAEVPESGAVLNNVLKKLYGINLLIPPPSTLQHTGEISSDSHKELWEKRSIRDWRYIGEEFKITGVLTKRDWNLLLPVLAGNDEMTLYEIPH